MPIGSVDERIKFKPAIFPAASSAAGILTVEIFGGPLARVSAAVFSSSDQLLHAIGFDGHGQSLITTDGGKVSWLFPIAQNAAYIKWSIQAFKSAANLTNYSVTSKIRSVDGVALVAGQFDAVIPDGKFADLVHFDGAELVHQSTAAAVAAGATV